MPKIVINIKLPMQLAPVDGILSVRICKKRLDSSSEAGMTYEGRVPSLVIPAKAGIQFLVSGVNSISININIQVEL